MSTISRWKAASTTPRRIVKALFADRAFAAKIGLTAVNSINFVRIAAQSVYYFTATAATWAARDFRRADRKFRRHLRRRGGRAHGACGEEAGDRHQRQRHHGAGAERGRLCSGRGAPHLSPSMDIQVASQFRARAVRSLGPRCRLDPRRDGRLRPRPAAGAAAAGPGGIARPLHAPSQRRRRDTLATINAVAETTGRIIDPHTAVAVARCA